MAYIFTLGTSQYIDYGTRSQFYLDQDLSFNGWFYVGDGARNDDRLLGVSASFPPGLCKFKSPAGGEGWGVSCEHVKGGSFEFGVQCVPGLIKSAYKWQPHTWMFFGFSRFAGNKTYYSYFGSRAALVDGQTFTYLPGQEPFPITQPGQNNGPFFAGMTFGSKIGPFSYWNVGLTREQHLAMARCTLPTGVDLSHLLVWSKMFLGAADLSQNAWPNTFHNDPQFEQDNGCASFTNGQDYSFHVS